MHLHSKILKQKQFPQKIWIIQPFRSTGTHSEIREVCFLVSLECALIYSPPVDLKYCDDAMMDDTGSMFSRDCWRWWQGAWWMWGHGPLWLGWHSFPLMFTLQVRSQAPWNADTWCLHTRTLLWWPFHHWSSITQMGHQVFRNQTQTHPSLYLSFFIVWYLNTLTGCLKNLPILFSVYSLQCINFEFIRGPMISVIQVLEAVGFIIGQFLGNLSVVFYPSLIYQIPSSSDNIQYWDSIGAFHCSSSLNSQVGAGYKIAGDIFLHLTVECIH